MAFTTNGQFGPEALLNLVTISGTQVYGPYTNITATAPAGYTATVDASGNLTVVGLPADSVTVTVKSGTTTLATLNLRVPPAISELTTVQTNASNALSTANSATTAANNATTTANSATTTANAAQTTANQALAAANSGSASTTGGSVQFVRKNAPAAGAADGTWPVRPTSSTAVLVFWDGPPNADGSGPPTVSSGTGGMLPGDKWLSHP